MQLRESRKRIILKNQKKIAYIFISIFIGLLVIWYSLGLIGSWYINSKIDEVQEISGDIGKLTINPIEGIYTIRNLQLSFASEAMDIPVIEIDKISINIDWGALLSGSISGDMGILKPDIRAIVKLPPEKAGIPDGPPLTRVFRNTSPVHIDFIKLNGGELRVLDETQPVPFEFDITELNGEISNLTNSSKLSENLYAVATARGIVKGSGAMSLQMKFNPVAEDLQFSLVAEIDNLNLTSLNDFADELAGITFESGHLSMKIELDASHGIIEGFIRTTYENMTILDPDDNDGFFNKLKEGVTGLLGEILENEENKIVTRVPVNLKTEGTRPDVFTTIIITLRQTMTSAAIPIIGEIL